ncbi:hypothetical protein VZT92_023320 [Zoarces viviparus]|uniref:Uncharacterized protein n=1 Tax=Zoarces viviparus TaxID=48416 RepID=A0AAW1E631_ZOAVI
MTSPACSRCACCGVPFLRIRPSVLPPEFARNWRKVLSVVTAPSPQLSKSRLCLKDGEEYRVCVFDAWECPASGEGREGGHREDGRNPEKGRGVRECRERKTTTKPTREARRT